MKRATLMLAALALLFGGVGQAEAGFLSPHGEATITITNEPGFTQQDGDTIFLQNSASTSMNNGNQLTSAIVHTNPSPQFLEGQASVTQLQNTSPFGGYTGAIADAQGIWRDVLSLSGPGPLPSAVTFHFTVEGQMLFSILNGYGPGYNFEENFGVSVGPPSTTGFGTNAYGAVANIQLLQSDISSTTTIQGFDPGFKFTPEPGGGGYDFAGIVSYTATYNQLLGGYGFRVAEAGSAISDHNSYTFVQWNDPLTVDFVTNTDGTPLSGFTPSFDSGLSLPSSAAPEPASLTLLAFGGVSLLGYAGLRRRRKVATA